MTNEHRAKFLEFLGDGFKIPGLVDRETGQVKLGDKKTIDNKIRVQALVRLANNPSCSGVKKINDSEYFIKIMKEDVIDAKKNVKTGGYDD